MFPGNVMTVRRLVITEVVIDKPKGAKKLLQRSSSNAIFTGERNRE
jgi:hypothetical protein